MTAGPRHETRALLRAHLSAASSYRHLTRHCAICHRLLRLATDSTSRATESPQAATQTSRAATEAPQDAAEAAGTAVEVREATAGAVPVAAEDESGLPA
jgi:hypothetical protein